MFKYKRQQTAALSIRGDANSIALCLKCSGKAIVFLLLNFYLHQHTWAHVPHVLPLNTPITVSGIISILDNFSI